jgi:ribosome-associated toxin RatA of RatAB toxin-antitoxin module
MNRLSTFTQKKLVGYSANEMYSLAADTNSYQEFVPFVVQSKVLEKNFKSEKVLLKIGFNSNNLSFTSKVLVVDYLGRDACITLRYQPPVTSR